MGEVLAATSGRSSVKDVAALRARLGSDDWRDVLSCGLKGSTIRYCLIYRLFSYGSGTAFLKLNEMGWNAACRLFHLTALTRSRSGFWMGVAAALFSFGVFMMIVPSKTAPSAIWILATSRSP